MLTKEECETALSKLWDNTFGTDCITGEDLDKYVDIIDGLIQYVFNHQPYKFEDLKPNMWVWDDNSEWIFKIKSVNSEIDIEFENGDLTFLRTVFEEGRFFPVTKAMEYQE